MRRLAVLTLVLVAIPTASANVDSSEPVGGKTYAEQMDAANAAFLAELKRRIERAGFEDVEIVPRVFVATGKDRQGRGVSLIVDSDTLKTLQVGREEERGRAG
jgi:hypothetical protein